MNPLIFHFKETPEASDFDLTSIEYDPQLNLNLNRTTKKPAILDLPMGTETFTRMGEGSDSDPSSLQECMGTSTATKVVGEGSDSDPSSIALMMSTMTSTFDMHEGSDVDPTN